MNVRSSALVVEGTNVTLIGVETGGVCRAVATSRADGLSLKMQYAMPASSLDIDILLVFVFLSVVR